MKKIQKFLIKTIEKSKFTRNSSKKAKENYLLQLDILIKKKMSNLI